MAMEQTMEQTMETQLSPQNMEILNEQDKVAEQVVPTRKLTKKQAKAAAKLAKLEERKKAKLDKRIKKAEKIARVCTEKKEMEPAEPAKDQVEYPNTVEDIINDAWDDAPNPPNTPKNQTVPICETPPPPAPIKSKPIRFLVNSSRIAELKNEKRGQYREHLYQQLCREHPDIAFEFTIGLEQTRVCNNIQKTEDGTYGICYREHCTFAHSLSELKDPLCSFDQRCNREHCRFRHSNESRQAYYERLGREMPNIPATSEKVRQPSKQTEPERPHLSAERPRSGAERPHLSAERPRTFRPSLRPSFVHSQDVRMMSAERPLLSAERPLLSAERPRLSAERPRYNEVPQRPYSKILDTNSSVIKVPIAMFGKAMEVAIRIGLTNFKIETY